MIVKDISTLNPREVGELQRLHAAYLAARRDKDYDFSDRLRTELASRGCQPPDYNAFHPVMESTSARTSRLAGRYLYSES